MIYPREAILLAGTKLKTRRVRLIITVVTTALLFSVLTFLACVTEGTVQSLKSFSDEGYGGRFLVQAVPLTYQMGPGSNDEIKTAMEPVQRDLIARKKAEAKRLGLTYDETSDQSLPLSEVKTGPSTTQEFANPGSLLVSDWFNKKNNSIPGTSYPEFQKTAAKAGAVQTYGGTSGNASGFMGPPSQNGGQVEVMVGGKEDVSVYDATSHGNFKTSGVASITTLGWRSMDGSLLLPFMLPGQSITTGKDGSVPIIAPYSAAEEILGLKALPPTATPAQKLDRLAAVRSGIADKTAQLCFRNGASISLVSQAVQLQKELATNQGKKDYTPPALQYQLPADACGAVTVKSDKRTADEKKQDAAQKTFDTEFSQTADPEQGIITIRIVGLTPDVQNGPSLSPTAVLTSVLTSTLGSGWVSPAKAVAANDLANKFQGGTVTTAPRAAAVYYAEFKTLGAMESFIKDQACTGLTTIQGPDGRNHAVDTSMEGDHTAVCISAGKVLTVSPYGNSAGAIEQFRSGIWKVARYALLIIVAIAAVIMMGNVGKVIADSRRESAVFRSLGAKRLDIAEIYVTYTVMISLLVAACAVVVGAIFAEILSRRFMPSLSVEAVLAYNARDIHKTFSLFGLNPLYILVIAGLAVAAGLISTVLPLLANTRRNPIRDMRDET